MPDVLLWGLIVFTLTHLLTQERGPFGLFARWRSLNGIGLDENGNIITSSEWAALWACSTCTAFWIAVGVTLFRGDVWYMAIAYWGISILLSAWVTR